ncbi:MAG: polyprenyl synthetase family protein [Coriobacteriia bacterium]|nr:polyprenyl synthetase family protein [Coriobacteriia bacterium]MCL2537179.1 polyprenyl synthetase family protein [Coriobacteriia bacterium]
MALDRLQELSFELYLRKEGKKIDDYLSGFYTGDKGAHTDMLRYLYTPLSEFSANAGKRHRPIICMLACEAVGGDPMIAMRSATAVEHFHTAALIHDDIQDGAETRRGEPCFHVKEGVALAINAGDLALSLVTGSVVTDPYLDDPVKIRVLGELVDMTTRTIEGQALDIGWARDNRFDLAVDDYLVMARHKTAFYSGAIPLAIGAIIGGASTGLVETLRSFGLAAGLAFQIQDDLINLTGSDRSKDFRIDITEGKRTLMAVHALNNAPAEARERLLDILRSHATDEATLEEAVQIMRDAGSIDYANDFATGIIHDAKAELAAALEPNRATKLLLSMADFFIRRSQ